jgi:hypothetical protein
VESPSCGYGCFTWVIDAHPEDIRMVDFARPDGTPVMRTIADYRQLNDALFHAGSDSGSSCEWEDAANRLHFYVIDLKRDALGIRSYRVGVRSLDGSGPQKRGVVLTTLAGLETAVMPAEIGFMLSNTGAAADDPALQPRYSSYDIYRLSVAVDAAGWTAKLGNGLAAVRCGDSQVVWVRVSRSPGSTDTARVTLTALSESDPSQSASAEILMRDDKK